MKTPTMVYKPGSKYTSDGVSYDVQVVDECDVEGCLKDGWFKHFNDFDKPVKKVNEKDELEAYAKDKFGVDLDKRKSLKKLKAEVEALENDSRD